MKTKTHLFEWKKFTSHSGLKFDWKINCDALTQEDYDCLAKVISKDSRFSPFKKVISIPRGGDNLARALKKYEKSKAKKVLVVDDVISTGRSMNEALDATDKLFPEKTGFEVIGLSLFNRSFRTFPRVEVLFILEQGLPAAVNRRRDKCFICKKNLLLLDGPSIVRTGIMKYKGTVYVFAEWAHPSCYVKLWNEKNSS